MGNHDSILIIEEYITSLVYTFTIQCYDRWMIDDHYIVHTLFQLPSRRVTSTGNWDVNSPHFTIQLIARYCCCCRERDQGTNKCHLWERTHWWINSLLGHYIRPSTGLLAFVLITSGLFLFLSPVPICWLRGNFMQFWINVSRYGRQSISVVGMKKLLLRRKY